MAFEDLLITRQTENTDRHRAAVAQGLKCYPSDSVMKKSCVGPFTARNGQLPAMPGYTAYIHAIMMTGSRVVANTVTFIWEAATINGATVWLGSLAFLPGTDDLKQMFFPVDVLCDPDTGVYYGWNGTYQDFSATVYYQWIPNREV